MPQGSIDQVTGAGEIDGLSKSQSGNCSFDVVLSPARVLNSPRAVQSPSLQTKSIREIDERMKAAQARRQSVEQTRLEIVKSVDAKATAAEQRREEFKKNVEEKLNAKIKAMEQNRDAFISERKLKLEELDAHVEEVKKRKAALLAQEVSGLTMDEINEKLAKADVQRQELLAAIRNRHIEHDTHVDEVRKAKENLTPQDSRDDEEN